jgi:1,4-dihydroxy-2-naphthoate polyprenyltransferase
VLGTFYVQSPTIEPAAIFSGAIVGILSATVLFVNSFPDFQADKTKGRRTLIILIGRKAATIAFPFFIFAAYTLIVAGIFLGLTKVYSLMCLASAPFAAKSILLLRKAPETAEGLVPIMASAVTYSRLAGFLLAISFIL